MSNYYGRLQNRMMENTKPAEITIGTGVTEVLYSDRHAYYVNKILKTKNGEPVELEIVRAKVKCNDYYAEDWTVFPFSEVEKDARKSVIKRTRPNKNGKRFWTDDGKMSSTTYAIGFASETEDPSF